MHATADGLQVDIERELLATCHAFEIQWRQNKARAEDFLAKTEHCGSTDLLFELLCSELDLRSRFGPAPELAEFTARLPRHASIAEAAFAEHNRMLPRAECTLRVDQQLGDYRLIGELGCGGMEVVYEAEQVSLGRRVALKVLGSDKLGSREHRRRFEREARAVGKLHHTSIVPVFGIGEEAVVVFYAMQLIERQPLNELIAARTRSVNESQEVSPLALRDLVDGDTVARATSDSVPVRQCDDASRPSIANGTVLAGQPTELGNEHWTRVARIGMQVAEALAYAQDHGVLHRDVKPVNLIFDAYGNVWVTDFGLAKVPDSSLTGHGDLIGTLRYRFLHDEPIHARRLSLTERCFRWAKRNPTTAALTGTTLLLLVALTVGSLAFAAYSGKQQNVQHQQELRRLKLNQEMEDRLDQLASLLARVQGDDFDPSTEWNETEQVREAVKVLLADAMVEADSRERAADLLRIVDQEKKDRRMAATLHELWSDLMAKDLRGWRDFGLYEFAFADYGLSPQTMTPQQVSHALEELPPRSRRMLINGLNRWCLRSGKGNEGTALEWPFDTLLLADDDPWRQQLREAVKAEDMGRVLRQVQKFNSTEAAEQPWPVILGLSQYIGDWRWESIRLLQRAWQRHPNDFHAALLLASGMKGQADIPWSETARMCTAAVAINPKSPDAHALLAFALGRDARFAEALIAIKLAPQWGEHYTIKGRIMAMMDKRVEAARAFQKAWDLGNDSGIFRHQLGPLLYQLRRYEEGVEVCRLWVERFPDEAAKETHYPEPIMAHAQFLAARGKGDAAEVLFREAIAVRPEDWVLLLRAAQTMQEIGRFSTAVELLEQAHERNAFLQWDTHATANRLVKASQLAAGDEELNAILAGGGLPRTAIRCLWMAEEICIPKRKYSVAVRLYQQAFKRNPSLAKNLDEDHRYHAICCAALAIGSGSNVDDAQKAKWCSQAHKWLQSRHHLIVEQEQSQADFSGCLRFQRRQPFLDADLAHLRDESILDGLPDAEQSAGTQFWATSF